MKARKVLATLLASAMVATALVGCGETATTESGADAGNTNEGNEETVVLTYYYPDDENAHTEVVWDALNAYLIEKINVEVDAKPISWGDYATKTNTIKSSGQDYDLMFESGTFNQSVDLGYALPITQYMETAGADMYAAIPESVWGSATVDGEIYGVPTYKDSSAVYSILYNKTLADEIGLEMPETMDVSIQNLEALFRDAEAKLVETFGEDHGYTVTNFNAVPAQWDDLAARVAVTNIPGGEVFPSVENGTVVNPYSTPEMLEYYTIMSGLVQDGIVPMDARTMDVNAEKATGTFLMELGHGYVAISENAWSPDYAVDIILPTKSYMSTQSVNFGTTIVGPNSANPEAAVAFLNLLNTDNFVANTIRFGVEGDYYTVTEDNRLDFEGTLNSAPDARAYYKWYGWQFGNIFAMSLPAQEDDTLFDQLMHFNETALSANMGFVFDTTSVTNEIAACSAIRTEYEANLESGLITDVEANLAEFNAKLTEAGIDKVVAEAQAQLDAWYAENPTE